ncbi:MAG: AIR synthase family protein [Nitrososphaerota archaeon]|nr:AIR synthase family protein [Nitrososphaerota archaeon]
MSKLPQYGKISKDFFDRVIYPNLGRRNGKVLVGPSSGVDTCVIRTGRNQVLVATTDPISFIPDLGSEYSAWQSVNLVASDLATSGLSPQFALFDFNIPPSMKSSDFEKYWKSLICESRRLDISIVGGHTSRFEGLDSTVIGAGMMFSLGREDECKTSQDGGVGDKVLVTKGAAIATTAVLAHAFPQTVRKKVGTKNLERAKAHLNKTTAVKDSLIAAKAGANAMHDATEGGVLSALYELAHASKTGLRVDLERIPVSEETRDICKIFKIDPYTSLSEGSLVLSCKPSRVTKVLSGLRSAGIRAAVVGELTSRKSGIVFRDCNGKESPIKYPVVDPYWRAYYDAKRRGLT